MIKILGILLVAGVIIYIESPNLKGKDKKRELIVFSTLLIFGVGLSVTFSLGKHIPNPMDLISFVFNPVNEVVLQWLK